MFQKGIWLASQWQFWLIIAIIVLCVFAAFIVSKIAECNMKNG
jgi:hypothetical protein